MRKSLLSIAAALCALGAGAQQQNAAAMVATFENPNEIFVIAKNGDWHGTTINSMEALRKTIEKGAQMAYVDLMRDEQGDVVLNAEGGSRPTIKEALEFCRGQLLLVIANPANYLDDIRTAAKETGTANQVFLYGMADPNNEFKHIALYQLGGSASLSSILSLNPVAVEIDYSANAQGLDAAIAQVKQSTRVMFNTADEGKCGAYADPAPGQDAATIWGELISMGGSVFLTNQIKPFMWYLHPETKPQWNNGGRQANVSKGIVVSATNENVGGMTVVPLVGDNSTNNAQSAASKKSPRGGGKGIDKSYDKYLTRLKETVPQKFQVYTYHDNPTGRDMEYNIYAPDDYLINSYPLVLFIPDASTVGKGPEWMLTQGYGALVWATDEWQNDHPCIVVVPAFAGPDAAVNDKWQTSDEVMVCKRLVERVVVDYNANSNRLYTTGQSMGGMISMFFDAEFPEYFAAAMFVSCQWDTNVLAPLAKQKFLYVISAADPKAAPKMQELGELLAKLGASWGEIEFSARLPLEQQNDIVEELLDKDYPINFIRFEPNTVMPAGRESSMAEHMYGFDAAYRLEALRDWLFRQTRW